MRTDKKQLLKNIIPAAKNLWAYYKSLAKKGGKVFPPCKAPARGYDGQVNCIKCGTQHWINGECPDRKEAKDD